MNDAPVALIVAKAEDRVTSAEDRTTSAVQWVLNIGGRTSSTKSSDLEAAEFNVAQSTSKPVSSPTSEAVANPSPESGSSLPQAQSSASPRASLSPDGTAGKPVEVSGGLVVPLYVIILSVMGGAINMTRRVPEYQERADVSLDEPKLMGALGKVTEAVQLIGRAASSHGSEGSKPENTTDQKKGDTVPGSAQSENTIGKEELASSEGDTPRPPETKEEELFSGRS
jgi:hypothetical protein